MKLKLTLFAFALLGAAGLATAADESAHTLDLSSVHGGTFFIKCENGRNVRDCESPSLWQDSNPMTGLQTDTTTFNYARYDRDTELLS